MTLHFVQLTLENKNYRQKVSTEGCYDVDDFKRAIKNEYLHLLGSYDAVQLSLFQPDGSTQIEPETPVTELKEIPWKPMVVNVEKLPVPDPIGSARKQLTYKGMSTEASCRKYLDAVANQIYLVYSFRKVYRKPTMGDVLAAKDGQEDGAWAYRKDYGEQLTTTPLPSLFSQTEWDILKSLNADTTQRIHDAKFPLTLSMKPFIFIPHLKFTSEYVWSLKHIAAITGVVFDEDDLVVKDESDLSVSSRSEPTSADKDKNM